MRQTDEETGFKTIQLKALKLKVKLLCHVTGRENCSACYSEDIYKCEHLETAKQLQKIEQSSC